MSPTATKDENEVDLIRKYFSNAGITTDIIVGFPTETDEDFINTQKLIERVKFSDIHPFPFSPRSGTVAFKMQDLPPQIKKARLNKLLEIKANCKENFAKSMVGKTLEFLFEEFKDGYFEGYSENYLRLYLSEYSGDGKIEKVTVIAPFKDGALAKIKE